MDWIKDIIIPLVSGIGGAIVGAATSYFASSRLAKRASNEVLERDKAARMDQDKRAAHQVFVKLHAIANSLGSFQKQTSEMVKKADRDGNAHMPIYQRLSPFAGIEREPSIEFSAEELAIYIGAKRADYADDLMLLSRRYAACLASLETFAKLKTELHFETARLGRTTRDAETGVSTTHMHVPAGVANYIKVKSEELNLFTTRMCQVLSDYFSFAQDVAERFEEATKEFLDGPIPGFQAIDDGDVTPSA
ncbi:hypothetical protein [Pseudoblastomonas halimionae]|uniref:Uncharacterized protein n=1 Tax=Alteriqipengyuania halimionae TaxID=1926630 RepID=A0A6I4U0S3_9SPHN|nr:hypothetical protein [Alteriqipengyuania halimionae]MXP09629.1 hypothetical protein [Alteriqipengyuania halimionae]